MSGTVLLPLILVLSPAARQPAEAKRPPVSTEEVRGVVAAIVKAAEDDAAKGDKRLHGDALLDYYVRRAAATAREQKVSPRAFLVALGLALDDTDLLRKNPLARSYLAKLESDAERARRLKLLGEPTLRKRHDWALHFAISAALTALFGDEQAERIGVGKELWDAHGKSGFSFADLAADLAGIEFARGSLAEGERRLREIAEKFEGDKILPAVGDLEDGLPWETFVEKYGGVDDERFRKHVEAIRRRVHDGK